MKKIILFSAVVLLVGAATTAFSPNDCADKYWATKKLYQPADTTCPQPPVGYMPVLINHVTRHGARHLTNVNELQSLQQMLQDAANANALTDKGVQLQKIIGLLLNVEKPEDLGLLTQAGKNEQQGIGSRMKAHYPSLTDDHNTFLRIETTKEKRTEQSAQSFMGGLGRDMQPDAATQVVSNDSIELRFFEVSHGYKKYKKKGNWIAEADKLEHSQKGEMEVKEILHEFFKDAYAAKMLAPATQEGKEAQTPAMKFADGLFGIATLPAAAHYEVAAAGYTPQQVDIRSLLTCDELQWLAFDNAAQDFLQKGPALDENGIQVRNAVPLLVDFINSSDSFLQANKPAILTRFAHAETMAPFAALLEVAGAGTPAKNIFDYEKVWNASEVMGFSANVQWIFYKSNDPGKKVLVKILYDEKPVRIPVATNQFPYYTWDAVKAFYLKKLASLHVDLKDNMLDYLVKLQ